MDQAPNQPPADSGTTPTTNGLSPTLPTWDEYYKEASRRRRAAGSGGRHQLRVEKRRRRWRERIGVGLSAVLVGAMTMIFYLLLR